MTGTYLSSAGLLIDLLGVIVLAFNGFPITYDPLGRDFVETSRVDTAALAKAARARTRGWVSLLAICAGLLLQLAGLWWPRA